MIIGKLKILVTGASGTLGKRVVEYLLADGRHHVVAGSRTPEKLGDLVAAGATACKLDLDDAETVAAAFTGIDRLLLVATDSISLPGQRLWQHKNAISAAVKAGIAHIAYTSMLSPEPPQVFFYAGDHYGTELALKSSGLTWTILRNGLFSEITYPMLQKAVETGRWVTAAGDGRVPYVARDDCAAAAAAVLTNGSGVNTTFNLTGPDALSVYDLASTTSKVFATPITVWQVSTKEKVDFLTTCGFSAAFAPIVAISDLNTALGRSGEVTTDVEFLTGRQPSTFEAVLAASKAANEKARLMDHATLISGAVPPR